MIAKGHLKADISPLATGSGMASHAPGMTDFRSVRRRNHGQQTRLASCSFTPGEQHQSMNVFAQQESRHDLY